MCLNAVSWWLYVWVLGCLLAVCLLYHCVCELWPAPLRACVSWKEALAAVLGVLSKSVKTIHNPVLFPETNAILSCTRSGYVARVSNVQRVKWADTFPCNKKADTSTSAKIMSPK